MTTRRVLIVHPGAELYGADRVMLESVFALVETGWDVRVMLASDGPLVAEVRAAGARVIVRDTLVLRKNLLAPRALLRSAASAVGSLLDGIRVVRSTSPDVIYISTVTLPLWTLIAKATGVPSVVHVHEGEAAARRVIKVGMYAPVALASAVIVNSEFSRGVLAQVFPHTAARARVVYNGVAGPVATPPRSSLEAGARIVFIGRLSPRKGPDLIVEALLVLGDRGVGAQLTIVGSIYPGYEWYERDLRDQIARAGLSDRVHLAGFQANVWPALAVADIAVIPSRLDEPFGNTAVEAVLAARLAIVSDSSGLREAVAGSPSAIRFEPDNAAALASAIEQAIETWPEIHQRLETEAGNVAERFAPARYRADVAASVTRAARTEASRAPARQRPSATSESAKCVPPAPLT